MSRAIPALILCGVLLSLAVGYNRTAVGRSSVVAGAGAPSGASVVLAPADADPDHDGHVSILDLAYVAQYFLQQAETACQTWHPQPTTYFNAQRTPVVIDAGYYSGSGPWAATVNAGGGADVRVCP